ncbi:MAG: ribulose-phosphate 3-epimerase [Clostridia bacterium]
MFEVIPSLASANQACIKDEIARLGRMKRLHLDIEDGNFVPNITFGMNTIRNVSAFCNMELDAHLMVTNPNAYIHALAECGVKSIAVHWETLNYPMQVINSVKDLNMKIGLAVNPRTNHNEINLFIDSVDYILVMTSEPDGKGQQFLPPMLNKISSFKKLLPPHALLWVDGGINGNVLGDVIKAGADVVILGRAIFSAPDPNKLVTDLQKTYQAI